MGVYGDWGSGVRDMTPRREKQMAKILDTGITWGCIGSRISKNEESLGYPRGNPKPLTL